LLPQLGVARGGALTEVAFGVAQPTQVGQTVHSMPVTSGHISVAVETIVKGFENFSLPVPMPAWNLETLMDVHGGFVTWPYAWVRLSAKVIYLLYYFICFYYFNCVSNYTNLIV
jgi:hypothetical protein